MTARPYELLARFSTDGSVAGVSVRTITTVNGRDYESDPVPLSGATDPAFIAFAAAFSAAIVAQRDQLLLDNQSIQSQVDSLTSERDGLQSQLDQSTTDNAALQTNVQALTGDRDSLASQLAAVTSERDTQSQRIVELESQLDALLHPPNNPRHLAPFEFLGLLKPEEIYALQTSVDPTVVVGRAKLQTIITFVDLDHPETIGLVQYMESAGLCEPGRAAQILSGEAFAV